MHIIRMEWRPADIAAEENTIEAFVRAMKEYATKNGCLIEAQHDSDEKIEVQFSPNNTKTRNEFVNELCDFVTEKQLSVSVIPEDAGQDWFSMEMNRGWYGHWTEDGDMLIRSSDGRDHSLRALHERICGQSPDQATGEFISWDDARSPIMGVMWDVTHWDTSENADSEIEEKARNAVEAMFE